MAPPKQDPWEEVREELAAGRLRPVYLFHGSEPYLVEQAWRAAVEAATPKGPRGFNRDVLSGADTSAEAVVSACRTLPMMAPRRLVVLKECDKLKGDPKPLLAYLKAPVDSAILVMSAPRQLKDGVGAQISRGAAKAGVDGRQGIAVEFRTLYDRGIVAWIRGEVARRGKRITEEGARFLLDMGGSSLGQLAGEIEKLCLYSAERPDLSPEDLEAVVADVKMSTVFDLTDAIGQRDLPGAILAIDRAFLQDRDPALQLLAMLARHQRQLIGLREELRSGTGDEQACAAQGLNPKMAWKYAPMAKRFGAEDLRRGLLGIDRAEQAMKSSRLGGRLVLERLAIDLCGAPPAGRTPTSTR